MPSTCIHFNVSWLFEEEWNYHMQFKPTVIHGANTGVGDAEATHPAMERPKPPEQAEFQV